MLGRLLRRSQLAEAVSAESGDLREEQVDVGAEVGEPEAPPVAPGTEPAGPPAEPAAVVAEDGPEVQRVQQAEVVADAAGEEVEPPTAPPSPAPQGRPPPTGQPEVKVPRVLPSAARHGRAPVPRGHAQDHVQPEGKLRPPAAPLVAAPQQHHPARVVGPEHRPSRLGATPRGLERREPAGGPERRERRPVDVGAEVERVREAEVEVPGAEEAAAAEGGREVVGRGRPGPAEVRPQREDKPEVAAAPSAAAVAVL